MEKFFLKFCLLYKLSPLPEILHILQDGKTGLLVPEGNAEKLAERIVELITRPGLPEALGQAARETVVDKFALSPMIQGTLGFYGEVLSKLQEGGLVSAM